MIRRTSRLGLVVVILLLAMSVPAMASGADGGDDRAPRPNVIVILLDDLGFSDLGCYGGEIPTPHIDRLAAEGLRFTNFYNAAKCEPSRAAIITGLYWPVAKLGAKRGLTLGEAMREAGYATCAIGKWHLDGNPVDRGFDRYFGHLGGASSYFPPLNDSFHLDGTPWQPDDPDFYATDGFTDFAIEFIENGQRQDAKKPFFIYLAYNAPHNPLQAPDEDIARHRGRYLVGWDEIRRRRHARQVELGLIDPETTPLSPRPQNVPAWDSLSPEQQDLEDLRMAVYAAMVDRLDQNVGRLLGTLEKLGIGDRTLIFLLSDNGASPFWRTDRPMLAAGKLPGDRDSNWEIGLGWANASNTPLRLYKRNQHEGGTLTPMLARWPDGIVQPGRQVPQLTGIIDIMPTLLQVAGGTYPAKFRGRENPPLSGHSLVPLFENREVTLHDKMYFVLYDHAALREGDLKLVRVDGRPWELFDLAADRTETRDLAAAQPETVRRLTAKFDDWRRSVGLGKYNNPSKDHELRDDRGGGVPYVPSAMPPGLRDRRPVPAAR